MFLYDLLAILFHLEVVLWRDDVATASEGRTGSQRVFVIISNRILISWQDCHHLNHATRALWFQHWQYPRHYHFLSSLSPFPPSSLFSHHCVIITLSWWLDNFTIVIITLSWWIDDFIIIILTRHDDWMTSPLSSLIYHDDWMTSSLSSLLYHNDSMTSPLSSLLRYTWRWGQPSTPCTPSNLPTNNTNNNTIMMTRWRHHCHHFSVPPGGEVDPPAPSERRFCQLCGWKPINISFTKRREYKTTPIPNNISTLNRPQKQHHQ